MTTHVGAILARLAYEMGALIVIHWIEVLPAVGGHTERGFLFRGDDVSLERWPDWKHHERISFGMRKRYTAMG